MRALQRTAIIVLCLIICLFSTPNPQAAAATTEETKLLLQKGLTIYEVDQELARIERQEQGLMQQMSSTEKDIQTQQALSIETKRHAAKVLRAYYMGDRDSLWMLIFSISSFKDALTTFEYLQMIVQNDRDMLQKHLRNQTELRNLQALLTTSKMNLQQTKERYLAQRSQLIELQKQFDADLAKQPMEAPSILQQMAQLTVQWQEKGVPLFKMYFQALAAAMKQLPEMITDSGSSGTGKNNHLIMNGFQYTFQISDQDLNVFLRSKNPIFRNMTFQFKDAYVIAMGKQDDMQVMIKGHYELATKGDDKPKAYIRFRMDQLQFNGFDLPRTTIDMMEKEFDLGIYPHLLASFLQVTDIKLEDGKFSVLLKLAL